MDFLLQKLNEITITTFLAIEHINKLKEQQHNEFTKNILIENELKKIFNETTELKGTNTFSEEDMNYYYSEGSVFKRKDGKYVAKIYVDKKQITIAVKKTKIEAIKQLQKAIELKQKGQLKEQIKQKYSLFEWLKAWIEIYKEPFVKPHTTENIRCAFKTLEKHIKDKPLTKITELDLQTSINSITLGRTRETIKIHIKEALTKAYKLKLIKSNPTEDLRIIAHQRTPRKPLTKNQVKIILELCEKDFKNLILFYLYTGCRPSEAIRIKKEHINENSIFIDGTKNKAAKRQIPLFKPLKKLLKEIPENNSDFLFNLTYNAINCKFKKLSKKIGFHISAYNLRHTFATNCHNLGVDDLTLKKWMGHSNVRTTQNIYIHITDEHELRQAERIDFDI